MGCRIMLVAYIFYVGMAENLELFYIFAVHLRTI